MKVFMYADTDYVVAEDTSDAIAVLCEFYGGSADDFPADDVAEAPAEKEIGIWCNADGVADEPVPGNSIVKLTAAGWAKKNGRGFLCSTEF